MIKPLVATVLEWMFPSFGEFSLYFLPCLIQEVKGNLSRPQKIAGLLIIVFAMHCFTYSMNCVIYFQNLLACNLI